MSGAHVEESLEPEWAACQWAELWVRKAVTIERTRAAQKWKWALGIREPYVVLCG